MMNRKFDSFSDVINKFNPYHDEFGRFTSKDSAHGKTLGEEKEREPEKQFGFTYGERSRTVAWEEIESEEYRRLFSKIINNDKLSKALHETALRILKHRDNTEYEDLYVLDADTGECICSISDSSLKHGVCYSDEFKEKLLECKHAGRNIVGIHNHPDGGPPSASDFRKAFENNYSFGVVVSHNGIIYKYHTPSEPLTKSLTDSIDEQVSFIVSLGRDPDFCCEDFYSDNGFKYETFNVGGELWGNREK